MHNLLLQKIKKSDEEILFEIFKAGRPDLFQFIEMDPSRNNPLLWQQFKLSQSYDSGQAEEERFLIRLGDEIVGKLYLRKKINCTEVVSIVILPQFRCRGIGTSLLRNIIADAFENNKNVELKVAWYNYEAKKLYEKLGFIEIENYIVYLKMQCKNIKKKV